MFNYIYNIKASKKTLFKKDLTGLHTKLHIWDRYMMMPIQSSVHGHIVIKLLSDYINICVRISPNKIQYNKLFSVFLTLR